MDALDYARRAKHWGLLARRNGRAAYVRAKDATLRVYDRTVPYEFDVDRHRDSWGNLPRMYFLDRPPPDGTSEDRPVPRVIYCLWTGDNPLGEARRLGLSSIVAKNSNFDVVLVTPETLAGYVVADHPLHSAFENLSLVHRADYLRAYLMHHHGGGYSDIKQTDHSWQQAWEKLSTSEGLWAVGYPEISSSSCGGRDLRLGPDVRRRFNSLIGFATFFFRPGTPFTAEWLREVERRLDFYSRQLSDHPGNIWGDNPGYPIGWIELGSDLFHPLQLKYLHRIGQDPSLLPHLHDHR